MQVKEEDYKLVENILLDSKGEFNSQQKEFIELAETKTIIAGPGAGKTTALAAKIVILLKKLKTSKSRDGICIITHTNVGVNEINNALIKAGVGIISHPHFIGTIHEFFNRYCVIPYFKYKYSHNNLIFDDQNQSDLEYYKAFISKEITWTNQVKYKGFKDILAGRINDGELFINTQGNWDITNSSKWDKFYKYKDIMVQAKLTRKISGFLNYDDTFVFAKAFLIEERFKQSLRNRFKYIFLDEFQDTHPKGRYLLDDLFITEKNVYQNIGDPYQTIGFDQPMPTIEEEETFRINVTNRFGNEIAEHLNVIIPESNIQTIFGEKKSFKPIILLYKEEEDIYPTFKSIIKDFEDSDINFKMSTKKDKVLILDRRWSSRVKTGALYKGKKQKRLSSKNDELKTIILDFIAKKVVNESGEKLSLIRDWTKNHTQILSLNKLLIKIIRNGPINESLKEVKDWVNILLEEKQVSKININNSLINNIKSICNDNHLNAEQADDSDDIYTIHSVKGETLRSVLLVDFDDKNLINVLLHRYSLVENAEYNYTHQNLLYVALSRVTHLFVFAIEENTFTVEQRSILEKIWRIEEVKSLVTV